MREVFAIALREFQIFANRYEIDGMKTIAEIRRDNLLSLIKKHGSIAKLNVALDLARTDATLSQLKNASPDSKTGAPKSMGDSIARKIETALQLERGWMDNVHQPIYDTEPAVTELVAAEPANPFGWPFKLVARSQYSLLSAEEQNHIETGILLTIKGREAEKLSAPARNTASA